MRWNFSKFRCNSATFYLRAVWASGKVVKYINVFINANIYFFDLANIVV